MSMFRKLAGIQYWGEEGLTQPCLDSVMRLLQYDDHILNVKILSDGERFCLLIKIQPIDLSQSNPAFQ